MKNFTLVMTFLMAFTHAFSQQPAFIDSLRQVIQTEYQNGNFNGSVTISREDKILLSQSAGYSDIENHIPTDSATKFNIASVGKLFTQVIILQLLQEDKIRLDDRIGKFFTGFTQPNADQITISHLLNHQSGLDDVYVNKAYLHEENYKSQDKVVQIIAREKLQFTPGTETSYSNSGYHLLGAIASTVEDKPLSQLMEERIFKPLGMLNSGSANTGDLVSGHAIPYEGNCNNAKRVKVKVVGDPPTGAGSQYSSSADLTRFYTSIVSDNILLDDTSKGLLFNHYKPASWDEIKKSGKIFGFVGGDTRGWSAKLTFMFLNSHMYGVAIVSNFDGVAHPLDLKIREIIH